MAHKTKLPGKTLFVGNLPYTVTNEVLETAFTEYGPIKSCFVVNGKDGKCKGFGYVVFSVREDSEKAQLTLKKVGGRKVNIIFANPKERHRNKKNPKIKTTEGDTELTLESTTENGVVDFDDDDEPVQEEKPAEIKEASTVKSENVQIKGKVTEKEKPTKTKKGRKKKKPKDGEEDKDPVTLIVTGLVPKDKKCLKNVLSGVKNIVDTTFPAPDRVASTALVTFKNKRAAATALGQINSKRTPARMIKAIFSFQERTDQKVMVTGVPKWCKLIVRNLSFKCQEDDLQKAFSKFGDITEVKIPLKADGKMFGYSFVQFSNMDSAKAAMEEMNAKPILGRPVAVDWALPRDKYQQAIGSEVIKENSKPSQEDSKPREDTKHKVKQQQKPAAVESSDEEEEEEAEVEQDDDEEEEEDDSENDDDEMIFEQGSGEEDNEMGSDSDNDDDDEDDDEGFSDGSSAEDIPKKPFKKSGPPRPSDVGEGKTVFIRNVSFDTLNEDLKEFMEDLGEIKSCRIVIDPQTEHSKGVAFVQFENKEDAEKCVMMANNEQLKKGGLQLDGRKLLVTPAVSREDATKMKTKPDKQDSQKDKRNLWLLREGLIRPGTQAAQGLSKEDLQKRDQVERQKRQRLKNPDVFVSPTRVCVHNIPTSVTDNQLRRLYVKAAGDKSAVIKECRVMRDLQRVNSSGLAKSRGYAFVEFDQHEHTLAALRYTNNNPELFGDKKRLIVEFSLESRSALRTKQERLERARAKQEMMRRNSGGKVDKTTRGKPKITVSQVQAPPQGVDIKKIPKGMPSHMGPKIRHKPRAPPPAPKKPRDALSRSVAHARREKRKSENTVQEPKKKKKRGGPVKTDNLDALINKYRVTFKQAALKKGSTKWFET